MPNDPRRVETVTGRGRRWRHGAEQKFALFLVPKEALTLARKKARPAVAIAAMRRFAVKTAADTLA